jgi:hypothetical protein
MAERKTTTTRRKTTTPQKLTAFHKVDDWYSRHNFGTRFAMFTFLFMYIIVILSSVDFSTATVATDANTTTEVVKATAQTTDLALVKITGYFAFAAMVLITLGENSLSKIGDILVKYKEAKKG